MSQRKETTSNHIEAPSKLIRVAVWAFGYKNSIKLLDLLELNPPEYHPPAVSKIMRLPSLGFDAPLTYHFATQTSDEIKRDQGLFRGAHKDGELRERAIEDIIDLQAERFNS